MKQTILMYTDWDSINAYAVASLSIILNIIVAIIGFLPSAFITISTVGLLGFKLGLVMLMIGESAGAIISFLLYRKGIANLTKREMFQHRYLQKLRETKGTEAFFLVLILRILPFVPSGIVTLTAALGQIKLLPFSIASTFGKIPALIIESYSVAYAMKLDAKWKFIFFLTAVFLFFFYKMWEKR